MKAVAVVLALALAAPAFAAPAGNNPMLTIAENKDLSMWGEMIKAGGADVAFSTDKTKVTMLAPSNEAVTAFTKSMGYTFEDLKKNHALVDTIIAYHTILGTVAGPKELFAEKDAVSVASISEPYKLNFKKGKEGAVTVTDVQGNTANVLTANLGSSTHAIHKIDKVLFSGEYWTDLGTLTKKLPKRFSTLATALTKAGLADKLMDTEFRDTIFVPTNEAFAKSGINLETVPQEKLADVLKYHVIVGQHIIPSGFKDGEVTKSFLGPPLTISYKLEKPVFANGPLVDARAYVSDNSGNTHMVVNPNIFVHDSVVHAIDGVLIPKAEAAPAPAAVAVATPAPAAAAPAPAAAAPAFSHPAFSFTIPKPFFPITVAWKPSGRKMLQAGGGDQGVSQYQAQLSQDATAQAIYTAVNSAADPSAVKAATGVGSINSQLQTRFSPSSTFFDGIDASNLGF